MINVQADGAMPFNTTSDQYESQGDIPDEATSVKIGTGIVPIPAWVSTDSIAIGRWPVRGCAWADRKDAESWVVQ